MYINITSNYSRNPQAAVTDVHKQVTQFKYQKHKIATITRFFPHFIWKAIDISLSASVSLAQLTFQALVKTLKYFHSTYHEATKQIEAFVFILSVLKMYGAATTTFAGTVNF